MLIPLCDKKKWCLIALYICHFLGYPENVELCERNSMCGLDAAGEYFSKVPCTGGFHSKTASPSYVSSEARNPAFWAVAWHLLSEACGCRNSSNVGVYFVTVCFVFALERVAVSGSVLSTLATVSSPCWQLHSESAFSSWSSLIFSPARRLMTASFLASYCLVRWYRFHLS